MNTNFTVAMSVYKNDNPEDFKTAVHSIYDKQTIRPSEIVLVKDGPVPAKLEAVVKELQNELAVMKVVPFEVNGGDSAARQGGMEAVSNELVAIMDADDVAVPNRFEMQLKAFEEHPEATVVGGNINEFIHETSNVVPY